MTENYLEPCTIYQSDPPKLRLKIQFKLYNSKFRYAYKILKEKQTKIVLMIAHCSCSFDRGHEKPVHQHFKDIII